jgi:nitroreductase
LPHIERNKNTDVLQAIARRRSVRRFKEKLVDFSILEKCVEAARLAPTAKNVQVIEYVAVNDKKLLPQVLNTVRIWAGVVQPDGGWSAEKRPQAYIAAIVNWELRQKRGASERNTAYDAGLAVENLVLVAEGLGLGSCVITSFGAEELAGVLCLPKGYEIAMLVALGYPDERPVIETSSDSIERWVDEKGVRHVPKRPLADILHRNGF